jgi:probable phosphoglycerate mutase
VTRLVLIRHGESWATVDRVVIGHDCRGLTPRGREQAEQLRDRLLTSGELSDATAFYASLMRRSAETAEIFAPAVGDGTLPLELECDVCEIHGGEGEGLSWDEWEAKFGNLDMAIERHRVRAPGAESVDVFVARVGAVLERFAADHDGGTIVVACHGGVVAGALEALCGLRYAEVTRYVENTALTELERDGDGRWWLVRFNDAAHLGRLRAD